MTDEADQYEFFCFSCGARSKDSTGWFLQFNGLICEECNIKHPMTEELKKKGFWREAL